VLDDDTLGHALPFVEALPVSVTQAIIRRAGVPAEDLAALRLPELSDGTRDRLAAAIAANCFERSLDTPLGDLVPALRTSRKPAKGSVRLSNVLGREGLDSWWKLSNRTLRGLLDLRNMGITSARELLSLGLVLAMSSDDSADAEHEGESRPDPSAYVERWGTIAAWALWEQQWETVGEATERVSSFVTDDAVTPREVRQAWLDAQAMPLALLANPELKSVYNLTEAIDSVFRALGEGQDGIVIARTLLLRDKPTLDELAMERTPQVTRERIRQIEVTGTTLLATTVRSPSLAVIQRAARRLRNELGSAAPIADLTNIGIPPQEILPGSHFALTDEAKRHLLLLWAAGPYEAVGDWLFLRPLRSEMQVPEAITAALHEATADGPVDMHACVQAVAQLGVRRIWARKLISDVGAIREFEGYVIPWTGTLADKMAYILKVHGEPMSREELHEALIREGALGTLGNYLRSDLRFLRLSMESYGLREWGGEEYGGIAIAMTRELDRHGGAASLDELKDAVERAGGSEASAVFYANGVLFKKTESGRYRLRTEDELALEVRPGAPSEEKDCFLLQGGWAFRHVVSRETLRGSGLGVPLGFCESVGITGATRRVELPSDFGPVRFTLTDTLNLVVSSLGSAAASLGCEIDDFLFVEHAGDRIEIRRVSTHEPLEGSPCDHAAQQIGLPGEGYNRETLVAAYWRALGLPTDRHPDEEGVTEKLIDRKDMHLLRLFQDCM
jgi:hypothetical protein